MAHTTRRRFRSWSLCFPALLGVFVAAAAPALASGNYPAALERFSGIDGRCPRRQQRCLICHSTAAGGEGTADQPFAQTLEELVGFSDGEAARRLNDALIELRDELPELDTNGDGVADVDSDGDGISDLDELAACMNPSGEEFSDPPAFGCDGAHLAPLSGTPGAFSSAAGWLLLVLAAGASLWRRREV